MTTQPGSTTRSALVSLDFRKLWLAQAISVYGTQVTLLAPELVILDMWMPTMSGVTFLNRLRREPRFSALPVIVVSGDRSFAVDVLSDAHVEFMLKPFEAAVLVERTRALIGPPLSIPA